LDPKLATEDFVEIIEPSYPEARDLFERQDHFKRPHIFGECNLHDLSACLRMFICFAMWTG
jgi:hypothetical protein